MRLRLSSLLSKENTNINIDRHADGSFKVFFYEKRMFYWFDFYRNPVSEQREEIKRGNDDTYHRRHRAPDICQPHFGLCPRQHWWAVKRRISPSLESVQRTLSPFPHPIGPRPDRHCHQSMKWAYETIEGLKLLRWNLCRSKLSAVMVQHYYALSLCT